VNPKNILIVHNQYQLAGGEDTVAENEGKLLKQHGYKVYYYIRSNREIDEAGLITRLSQGLGSFFSIKTYREVNQIIRRKKIDIVHVHNTVPLISCSVYYAAKRNGCGLVQSVHNMRMLCPTGLMIRNNKVCDECIRRGLKCAIQYKCYKNSGLYSAILAASMGINRVLGSYKMVDAYLVTTAFNRELLKKVVSKEKIYMKPYCLDSQLMSIENKKRQYYIYISRLEYLKGIQVALKAFRKLPDQKLIVLGVGPDEEKSKEYVCKNKMNHVTFMGFKNKTEMRELLYHAKALIFPTQWYEGYPMTIVESFAVGTPVIGSNIGNVGQMIQDHVNGLLFQYNSPDDLVNKIHYFQTHEKEVLQMEKAAQEFFKKRHTSEQVYKRTKEIYMKIMEKNKLRYV